MQVRTLGTAPVSSLKERLAKGDIATMALVNYTSPPLVEHLGALGFDMALIDCEKGSATTERIEEMCRAARAAGIVSVVRPWAAKPGLISRYLDLGADGVMVAGVETPDEARDLVEAVRYARWKDHARKFVVAMIESPTAIARLPELLKVDGVDAWFIGPNDLAHRMGMPGRADHPDVQSAVRGALAVIRDAGRIGGTVATQDVRELVDAGARILLTRVTDLLQRGAAAFRAELSAAHQRHGKEKDSG